MEFFIFLERSLGLSEARVNDPHLFALQVLSHFVTHTDSMSHVYPECWRRAHRLQTLGILRGRAVPKPWVSLGDEEALNVLSLF